MCSASYVHAALTGQGFAGHKTAQKDVLVLINPTSIGVGLHRPQAHEQSELAHMHVSDAE